jgi:hypothetical protein
MKRPVPSGRCCVSSGPTRRLGHKAREAIKRLVDVEVLAGGDARNANVNAALGPREAPTMDYLVTMTTPVPAGTSDEGSRRCGWSR